MSFFITGTQRLACPSPQSKGQTRMFFFGTKTIFLAKVLINTVLLKSMYNQIKYQIGLTLIPGVGDALGKKLVAYCGGPEAVFSEKKSVLAKIPGIGSQVINNILNQNVFSRVDEEMAFMDKNNIKSLFYLDTEYPKRLQHCVDSPMVLYYKGTANLNVERIVGIVGTRNATDYGKYLCEKLVDDLASDQVLIVSGLAYGIDVCSHRAALKNNIPTVGVLGHGLDKIYPHEHRGVAEKMLENGGLLTEMMSKTIPDRENFPRRNRIVAGMIDALIVVESAKKGGALITARIANSYNKDVFAYPGKVGDMFSEGCNYLIRTNQASLIENIDNLRYMMRWDAKPKAIQTKAFREFSEDEQLVMDSFGNNNICTIDEMIVKSDFSTTRLASILLTLEFDGVLVALPGKRYQKVM